MSTRRPPSAIGARLWGVGLDRNPDAKGPAGRECEAAKQAAGARGASVTSVALGLFLSALVERQNSLIALVPIALIPQLVFSDVLIPNPPRLVERLEWLIPATWGLDALRALGGSEPEWSRAAADLLALSGLGLTFLVLAVAFLSWQDE